MSDHGSPPLARGQGAATDPVGVGDRITPARAGTGPKWKQRRPRCADHPRSRGDRTNPANSLTPDDGSPPLARGQVLRHEQDKRPWRITPARAGTGPRPSSGRPASSDHPRSRGDRAEIVAWAKLYGGSPPLARGQGADRAGMQGPPRITPARAGTGAADAASSAPLSDHPRSRGDRVVKDGIKVVLTGSPPLARGQVDLV